MRSSPAVSYPLYQSRLVSRVWLLVVASGVLFLGLWSWSGAGMGLDKCLRIGIAVFVWGMCAWLGWSVVALQPQGVLHWSGKAWTWELDTPLPPLVGIPVVLLDVRGLLLLRFVDGSRRTQRMVLQRNWAPQKWADLRRAVYSSTHSPQSAASPEGV